MSAVATGIGVPFYKEPLSDDEIDQLTGQEAIEAALREDKLREDVVQVFAALKACADEGGDGIMALFDEHGDLQLTLIRPVVQGPKTGIGRIWNAFLSRLQV